MPSCETDTTIAATKRRSLPFVPSTWESTSSMPWIEALDKDFELFTWNLKKHNLVSSSSRAIDTIDLIERYLTSAPSHTTTYDILAVLRNMTSSLIRARPTEIVVGNMARRILHIIRYETVVYNHTSSDTLSLDDLNISRSLLNPIFSIKTVYGQTLLSSIIDTIQTSLLELRESIIKTDINVADQAQYVIHSQEIILTYGYSRTVMAFLRKAASSSPLAHIRVFVCESAPSFSGRRFATELASIHGLDVTIIPDSNIFAVMPLITKLIIGASAIFANGGVLADTGAANIAMTASHYHKPLLVLGGTHKIGPQHAYDHSSYNEQRPPSQLFPFGDALEGRIDVHNPAYDYLPPDQITLFITDEGAHPSSHIYHRLRELYTSEDHNLE